MTAEFSPALVAGMALPPFATPLIGRLAQSFATRLWQRHRENFDRLEEYQDTVFLIDPTDLPLLFLLEMAPQGPQLKTMNRADPQHQDHQGAATIRGSIQALLDMAEGKVDGDSLFFARDLRIQGDTEAVVALRNAIDDAEIDFVEEIASAFGPLAKPAANVTGRAIALAGRITQDFDRLQQAIASPTARRLDAQEATIETLTGQVVALEQKVKRQAARIAAQERKAKDGKA